MIRFMRAEVNQQVHLLYCFCERLSVVSGTCHVKHLQLCQTIHGFDENFWSLSFGSRICSQKSFKILQCLKFVTADFELIKFCFLSCDYFTFVVIEKHMECLYSNWTILSFDHGSI